MRSPTRSKRQRQNKKHYGKSPARPQHRSLPEQNCLSPQSVHGGLFTQAACSLRPCKRSICFLYRRKEAAKCLMPSGGRAEKPRQFFNSKEKPNCSLLAVLSDSQQLLRIVQKPPCRPLVSPGPWHQLRFTA